MAGKPVVGVSHIETSARAARDCHERMVRGEHEFYVYYKTREIKAMSYADMPISAQWTLAWAERVPENLTADQLVRYFAERTGRLPYLSGSAA